jgi:hydrogenase expression/formation protein HypD
MAPDFLPSDTPLAARISKAIADTMQKIGRPVTLMEVCGTHTMAIAKQGLRAMLPAKLRLVSGPGCPVCVSAQEDIDRALALAQEPGVIITTFGDMLKVKGTETSLESIREHVGRAPRLGSLDPRLGGDLRIVYSPADAVEIAAANPDRKIIFLGAGFETTAPAIAASVLDAQRRGLKNFYILPMLKLVPPALRALLDTENKIDGFLLPGHVSAIIGEAPYRLLETDYKVPSVIAGFEAAEILRAVHRLLEKILSRDYKVENAYSRVVHADGNPAANAITARVFEPADAKWRALGILKNSGLAFRKEFQAFDATANFALPNLNSREPQGCICGLVITGRAQPSDCPLFGKTCTPADAVGPCMVSSEGACAARYYYG